MKNITGKKPNVDLLIAKNFLKYHTRSDEPTNFEESIRKGLKIHMIRSNFQEWNKKIKRVESKEAVLTVKQWSGVEYRSPQVKLFQFKENVGIQRLELIDGEFIVDGKTKVDIEVLAKNDGLTVEDFKDWFKVIPTSGMAIIHFTKFRY